MFISGKQITTKTTEWLRAIPFSNQWWRGSTSKAKRLLNCGTGLDCLDCMNIYFQENLCFNFFLHKKRTQQEREEEEERKTSSRETEKKEANKKFEKCTVQPKERSRSNNKILKYYVEKCIA